MNQHIPTMPQTGGHIPTMPQGGHIPTMPQGGHIPTMPQGGHIPTMPQGGAAAAAVSGRRGLLRGEHLFFGNNGNSYTILGDMPVSLDSGESQIYRCRDLMGDDQFVARILTSVTPQSPASQRVARERIISFLNWKRDYPNSHILPLLDHGTMDIDHKNYYVEVYPYCPEGDLGRRSGQISYQELTEEIIPGINEALNEFHSANLVHRDLKPDNLYRYNGRVVIGDFGITCELGGDGFATDEKKTGTLGYFAPELMSQAAVKKSDYYSFGQTIWTLYSGEMMYQNILRTYAQFGVAKQREVINQAMLTNKLFGFEKLTAEDEFLEVLVRGLLMYDINTRFDYEKVNRWLSGDKSVAREVPTYGNASIFTQPFRWNQATCWDRSEMHQLLSENWDSGKQLLYDGTIHDFFSHFDYTLANQIDQIGKAHSKSGREADYDVGYCQMLMLLCDGKELSWQGNHFVSFGAVSAFIRENPGSASTLTPLLASLIPAEWYRDYLAALPDDPFHRSIALVQEFSVSDAALGVALAGMVFTDDPDNIRFRDCRNMDELISLMVSQKETMLMGGNELAADPGFAAFLMVMGYEENARFLLKTCNSGGNSQNTELLYTLFEQVAESAEVKEKLRTHYAHFGPRGYLRWWRENLNLYTFTTEEAKTLRSEIEDIPFDEQAPLAQQREDFEDLKLLSLRFRELFTDNVFLTELGFCPAEPAITSGDAGAFWHYSVFEHEVPLAYSRYANIFEGGEQHG